MNDRQENNLSMKLAVEKVLDANQVEWNSIIQFDNSVADYKSKLLNIVNERQIQEQHLEGIATDKAKKKELMCKIAFEVASIVKSYASPSHTNNDGLMARVKYSITDLLNARDTISHDRCLVIYNAAFPISGVLVNEYGLGISRLSDLNTAMTNYTSVLTAPREKTGERKSSGVNIESLLKETDKILKDDIDNMMLSFKTSKPDFYKKYTSARMIIDSGMHKKEATTVIQGLTLNFETEKPEGAVKVRLEDGSSETVSNAAGEFKLPVSKEGTVTIIAEKAGFVNYEEDVDVVKGEDLEMNIDLEPEGEGEEVPPVEN